MKNVGDEPIEELRLEVSHFLLGIHDRDAQDEKEWGILDASYAKPPSAENFKLNRKLLPGEVAKLSLTRACLQQMKLYSSDHTDKLRMDKFHVRCFSRLIGGASFDPPVDDARLTLSIAWTPEEIDLRQASKYLKEYEPVAEIVPTSD